MRDEQQLTESSSDRTGADRELSDLLDSMILRALELDESYGALWSSLALVGMEGSGMRAGLVRGVHDALGGTDHDGVAAVGAALELLHAALRIHDEVIERASDQLSTAAPGVAARFTSTALGKGVGPEKAQHWGDSAAILAGDLSLHHAQRIIAIHDFDTTTMTALLELFDKAVSFAVAGSLVDSAVDVLAESADETRAIKIAVQKLAVYSFEVPMRAGAILAGARPEHVDVLATVGRHLGVAFQLVATIAEADRHTRTLEFVVGFADTEAAEVIVARHLDAALTAVVESSLPDPLRLYLTGVALSAVRRPS